MQIRAPGSSGDLSAEPSDSQFLSCCARPPAACSGRGDSGPDALQPPAPGRRGVRATPGPEPADPRCASSVLGPLGRPVAPPALNSSHRGAPQPPPPPPPRHFHGELVSLRRRSGLGGGRRCGTGWSRGRKAGPGPGAGGWGVGVGADRGNGTCAASWQPRRPARRGGHPDAFSLWVTGPRRTRARGRAAPQVSPSGSRLRAWWEVRARGSLALAGGPHAVPTRATPGASQGSLSPRGAGAARILPGPWRGLLGLHNLGFPQCPGSPETGGGTRRGPSTGPAGSCPPPEPEHQRDVEGVRRRLVRTLLLSRAPLGFRSSSPVPPPA